MVNAVALTGTDEGASARPRIRSQLLPFLSLISPAVLLGVLHTWSLSTAPRYGVYFTAEALLIVYAFLAIARAVHVHARSYDDQARYDARHAQEARRGFYQGLLQHWPRIAACVLPLLLVAFALDALTADTAAQYRANVHLSVLFVQLMAWWRYGTAIVIASTQWAPPRSLALARARLLAADPWLRAARSLRLANVALSAAALASIGLQSKWLLLPLFQVAPSARLVFGITAALSACLAWLALLLMCHSALAISLRLQARRAARSRAPERRLQVEPA
jgi:hypothetical protein